MPNEDRPEPPLHPSFGATASWLLIAIGIVLVLILVRALAA